MDFEDDLNLFDEYEGLNIESDEVFKNMFQNEYAIKDLNSTESTNIEDDELETFLIYKNADDGLSVPCHNIQERTPAENEAKVNYSEFLNHISDPMVCAQNPGMKIIIAEPLKLEAKEIVKEEQQNLSETESEEEIPINKIDVNQRVTNMKPAKKIHHNKYFKRQLAHKNCIVQNCASSSRGNNKLYPISRRFIHYNIWRELLHLDVYEKPWLICKLHFKHSYFSKKSLCNRAIPIYNLPRGTYHYANLRGMPDSDVEAFTAIKNSYETDFVEIQPKTFADEEVLRHLGNSMNEPKDLVVNKCIVEHCKSTKTTDDMCKFSTRFELYKLWIKTLNISPKRLENPVYICMKHFENQFVKPNMGLKNTAIPTLDLCPSGKAVDNTPAIKMKFVTDPEEKFDCDNNPVINDINLNAAEIISYCRIEESRNVPMQDKDIILSTNGQRVQHARGVSAVPDTNISRNFNEHSSVGRQKQKSKYELVNPHTGDKSNTDPCYNENGLKPVNGNPFRPMSYFIQPISKCDSIITSLSITPSTSTCYNSSSVLVGNISSFQTQLNTSVVENAMKRYPSISITSLWNKDSNSRSEDKKCTKRSLDIEAINKATSNANCTFVMPDNAIPIKQTRSDEPQPSVIKSLSNSSSLKERQIVGCQKTTTPIRKSAIQTTDNKEVNNNNAKLCHILPKPPCTQLKSAVIEKCIVASCSSKIPCTKKLFCFDKSFIHYDLWLEMLHISSERAQKKMLICEDHFESFFYAKNGLLRNAIPTLNVDVLMPTSQKRCSGVVYQINDGM